MSGWKKLITSGSNASLNSLTTSNNLTVGGNINVPNISTDGTANNGVIVVNTATGQLFQTGSFNSGTTTSNTTFQTNTNTTPITLTNLDIQDFASDVTATVDSSTGTLTLTFGTAASATFTGNGISISGFATNRFDSVNDDYTISIQYNIPTGVTFNSLTLQRANVGSTSFSNIQTFTTVQSEGDQDININNSNNPSETNLRIGSHKFRATLNFTRIDGTSDTIESGTVSRTLSKLEPSQASFSRTFSISPNGFRDNNFIEEGVTGTITYAFNNGNLNNGGFNGWVSKGFTGDSLSGDNTVSSATTSPGTLPETLTATGTANPGTHIEHFDDNDNNSTNVTITKTLTGHNLIQRIISLRFGKTTQIADFTTSQLQNLSSFPPSGDGTILFNTNSKNEINNFDEIFIEPINEFIYMIYDKSLGQVNQIRLLNPDTGAFIAVVTSDFRTYTQGNYRIYISDDPFFSTAGSLRFQLNI